MPFVLSLQLYIGTPHLTHVYSNVAYRSLHACMTSIYFITMMQEANLYVAAQEIAYLDNVVQETLRLYPPAPE